MRYCDRDACMKSVAKNIGALSATFPDRWIYWHIAFVLLDMAAHGNAFDKVHGSVVRDEVVRMTILKHNSASHKQGGVSIRERSV